MLYLIKQETKEQNYLKIGYAKNVQERLKTYNTHNADFKLLDIIEGDRDLEMYAHNLALNYVYKGEWFYENPEIYITWKIVKMRYQIEQQELKIKELEKQVKELTEKLNNSNNVSIIL